MLLRSSSELLLSLAKCSNPQAPCIINSSRCGLACAVSLKWEKHSLYAGTCDRPEPWLTPAAPSRLQARPLFSLPGAQASKRREYSERRLLGYTMDQMYDIVSGVELYTDFVPYCTKSAIISRRPSHLKARLAIGFGPIQESYTSSVTMARPHLVKAVCTEGRLFNHLMTVWKFAPGLRDNPRTCILDFNVSFEFRSTMHSRLANIFFDEVVRQMVNSFLREANRRYGGESIRSQKPKIIAAS